VKDSFAAGEIPPSGDGGIFLFPAVVTDRHFSAERIGIFWSPLEFYTQVIRFLFAVVEGIFENKGFLINIVDNQVEVAVIIQIGTGGSVGEGRYSYAS